MFPGRHHVPAHTAAGKPSHQRRKPATGHAGRTAGGAAVPGTHHQRVQVRGRGPRPLDDRGEDPGRLHVLLRYYGTDMAKDRAVNSIHTGAAEPDHGYSPQPLLGSGMPLSARAPPGGRLSFSKRVTQAVSGHSPTAHRGPRPPMSVCLLVALAAQATFLSPKPSCPAWR